MNKELSPDTLRRLKLLALDFDGVLTDGFVYVDQDGREMVRCSRRDGLGIGLLKETGIEVIIISKEKNPVVDARCRKLNLFCYSGIDHKLQTFKKHLEKKGISPEEAAYVGDDVNDLEVMKFVGMPLTVADGAEEVKRIAHYITERKGGEHAVREICDLILKTRTIS